jgi:hypothetical protein
MKKNIFTLNPFSRLVSMAILLLTANTAATFAGDAEIESVNFHRVFYLGKSLPVSVTFKNDEAFDVTDMSVDFNIYYQLDKLTWELKYSWSQSGFTVPANSQLVVTTGEEEWSPELSGRYKLQINSFSAVDIDPTNNDLTYNFIAGNFKRIALKQLDFKNPFQIEKSTLGSFYIKTPMMEKLSYINVMGRNPITMKQAWIVKNFPLLPLSESSRLYYHFDYRDLGYEEGDNVDSLDIVVQEDTVQRTVPFDAFGWLRFNVWNIDYNVPADNEQFSDLNTGLPGMVSMPSYDSVKITYWKYRGNKMPNIDLDSSSHKSGDNYAGDWNAAGPAGAANSLQWLEDSIEAIPSTGTMLREKMEELSGFMNRENEGGTNTEKVVKGKLGYIDKYKLPIHVKYQSWWNQDDSILSPDDTYGHYAENMNDDPEEKTPPQWEFLKSEMDKGEDVEMGFGWYDYDNYRYGGHMVTVSGIAEDSKGKKGLFIKDDWDQSDSAGTRETFLLWQEDEGWGRLVGFDGSDYYCWVECIVSESYDSTITFEEPSYIKELPYESGTLKVHILNNPGQLYEDIFVNLSLQESSNVEVELYNLNGQLLSSLKLGKYFTGTSKILLPGSIFSKSAGEFIIVFKTKDSITSGKFIVL